MSDKTRFYSMTKPIKFRRFKMIKNCLGEVISSVIKYNYYIILYKLKIIKRYSYRDEGVRHIEPAFKAINFKVISTKHFKGLLVANVEEEYHIDMDYFYKLNKEGKKVIKYVVKDVEEKKFMLTSHLRSLHLRVEGSEWYDVHNLPKFKMVILDGSSATSAKPLNRTVTYDLLKLKKLSYTSVLNINSAEGENVEEEIDYTYNSHVEKFKNILNGIQLSSLEVEVNEVS